MTAGTLCFNKSFKKFVTFQEALVRIPKTGVPCENDSSGQLESDYFGLGFFPTPTLTPRFSGNRLHQKPPTPCDSDTETFSTTLLATCIRKLSYTLKYAALWHKLQKLQKNKVHGCCACRHCSVHASLDFLFEGKGATLPKVADNTAHLLLTSVNAATDGNVPDAKLYTLHFHTLTKGDPVDLDWIDCSSAN